MKNRQSLWPSYAPPELEFSHGKGSYLYLEDGTEYLDLITGIAVNSLGHCHPQLVETLQNQTHKLWHLSNMFRITQGETLSRDLCRLSFGDNVFITNSGGEAVEAAIKAARRYHFEKKDEKRFNIIGFSGSFHGRSIATIAASGNPQYCKGFIPFDYGFKQCEWENIQQLECLIDDTVAAVLIEPVQGEGGVRVASQQFINRLSELCKQRGALLIFDEVQCGIYRTGTLFNYQQYSVEPDIMSLAKGLGCGFPVGACITRKAIGDTMQVGTHGSTFGGNPLATSVASKVLEIMQQPGFTQQLSTNISYLWTELRNWQKRHQDILLELTGCGMMIGLKFNRSNIEILKELRDLNILVGKSGNNLVRLLPPLNIKQRELESFFSAIDKVLLK